MRFFQMPTLDMAALNATDVRMARGEYLIDAIRSAEQN
jgi:hypothetical protein